MHINEAFTCNIAPIRGKLISVCFHTARMCVNMPEGSGSFKSHLQLLDDCRPTGSVSGADSAAL